MIDIGNIASSLGIGGLVVVLFYLYASKSQKALLQTQNQILNLYNEQKIALERLTMALERIEQTLKLHNELMLNILTTSPRKKHVAKEPGKTA